MIVRDATVDDIPAMSRVLIASISVLCTADHRDDPVLVARWTSNKTIEGIRAMMEEPQALLFVAVADNQIAAVGSIRHGNTIGLNYVDPAYRYRGASSMLLSHMENKMAATGQSQGYLVSTATARGFYQDRGWVETGPGIPFEGYPMRKYLQSMP